jgi:hypothetical protein
MRRREIIAWLGSAAAWPVLARAQQPAIGMLLWTLGETDLISFAVTRQNSRMQALGGRDWSNQ